MTDVGLYEAMRTLRAVRRLRPDPIPADMLHRVLEAATWVDSTDIRVERVDAPELREPLVKELARALS